MGKCCRRLQLIYLSIITNEAAKNEGARRFFFFTRPERKGLGCLIEISRVEYGSLPPIFGLVAPAAQTVHILMTFSSFFAGTGPIRPRFISPKRGIFHGSHAIPPQLIGGHSISISLICSHPYLIFQ